MSQNLIEKLRSYIEFNEDEQRFIETAFRVKHLFAISIFIPFCDGLVIIGNSGLAAPLLIHWGTAFYMVIVTAFLLRRKTD